MTGSRTERILVAMSGGVDSSVVAALLREQGHDVVGVTLHLWEAEGEKKIGRCCSPEDIRDAERVSSHLGIPHYVFDESEGFREHVVDPFVRELGEGRTPSPCVRCNRSVKIETLLGLARALGAERLATGHYAKVASSGNGVQLLRGLDRAKDQSYFLFGLSKDTLAHLICPLGNLTKEEVRAEARRFGLPNAEKPDSQELCFVPDGDVAGFVERQGAALTPGPIRDVHGTVLGKHSGIVSFTVGQRKGLRIGGGPPRYVLQVLPARHEIIVGPEDELFETSLKAEEAHWIVDLPREPFRASLRIRYRHDPAPAEIVPGLHAFVARFDQAQRAITPGQAAVVYAGEQVLGGGFIAS